MALPTPYISNINGIQDNALRIAEAGGPFATNALVLDNDSVPGTPRITNAAGTLAKVRVGAPSANDDVATKNYVDTSPAANAAEQIVGLQLNYNSSSPVTSTFTLPNNAFVTKVQVLVSTAFDGTGGTVEVGWTGAGNTAKFMATSGNNLKVQGVYTREQFTQQNSGISQAVVLTYTAPTGSPTVGAANVLVWFVIQPKA